MSCAERVKRPSPRRCDWLGFACVGLLTVLAANGISVAQTCGASLPSCAEGFFCERPPGECQVEGTCVGIPATCLPDVEPVCGCDGESYINSCHSQQARISVASLGACEEDLCNGDFCIPGVEFCKSPMGSCNPFDYEICFGGDTTPSPDAYCAAAPESCPPDYDPVCTCVGVTADNACMADQYGVSVYGPGPCPRKCGGVAGIECDDPEEICYLECDGCFISDLQGYCFEPPTECPSSCAPVCGCDGSAYRNRCESQAAGEVVLLYEAGCGELTDLLFVDGQTLEWTDPSQSDKYNVYRAESVGGGMPGPWSCFDPGRTEPSVVISQSPPAGDLWYFGVTGVDNGSDGPLGFGGSACTDRVINLPCQPM